MVSFYGGGDNLEFALVEVFGAVVFGAFEVPGFDGEVFGFGGAESGGEDVGAGAIGCDF